MKLVLLEEAQRQFEAEDTWWRENRDAKGLFLEEFSAVLGQINTMPELGQRYRRTRDKLIQRMLMKKTRCHYYYFVTRRRAASAQRCGPGRSGDWRFPLGASPLIGWLTLGGLSAVALGVWMFAGAQRGAVSSQPAPASAPATVTAASSAEPPRSDRSTEGVPLAALPPSSARAPSSANARPESSANQSSDGLEREIQVLDRARRLLAVGNAMQARRTIEQQPFRSLAPEAEALRIEALVASGDRARADRLIERFLKQHPASPLAARVTALRSRGKGTP